jgi:hypothetical protein
MGRRSGHQRDREVERSLGDALHHHDGMLLHLSFVVVGRWRKGSSLLVAS